MLHLGKETESHLKNTVQEYLEKKTAVFITMPRMKKSSEKLAEFDKRDRGDRWFWFNSAIAWGELTEVSTETMKEIFKINVLHHVTKWLCWHHT